MKRLVSMATVSAGLLALTGCARLTTQVVEKPRVDQELQGNRGYLQGSAPAAAPRRATRKILQTDVELPTAQELTPWKVHKGKADLAPAPAAPEPQAARPLPSEDWQEPPTEPLVPAYESMPASPAPAPAAATYVVKKGDTLEKIAAHEYGDSKKWYRIYKANKEKLGSPNRLRVGQVLVIPPADKEQARRSSSDIK